MDEYTRRLEQVLWATVESAGGKIVISRECLQQYDDDAVLHRQEYVSRTILTSSKRSKTLKVEL